MSTAAAMAVRTHGCKCATLQVPYFIAVFIYCAGRSHIHLPAVVDDFGDLVIVGGPL